MFASDYRTLWALIATGVLGPISLILGLFGAIRGLRTRKWPSAQGVITTSRVEPQYRDRWGTQFYRVVMSYHFSTAGTSQVGERVSIGDSGGDLSAEEAQRRAQRYAEGVAVEVHYDPFDPSQTVLETGISGTAVGGILFGIACLGVAIVALLRSL